MSKKADASLPSSKPSSKPSKGQAKAIAAVKSARSCSVPLVAITTADQASTVTAVAAAIQPPRSVAGADKVHAPKLVWDIVRGIKPLNDAGCDWCNKHAEAIEDTKKNPYAALELIEDLPDGGVMFYMNAQRWINDPSVGGIVVQAIWNLRDLFKADQRMLILLAPSLSLPPELSGDVVVIDEPLPQGDELAAIIAQTHENAEVALTDKTKTLAVEAVQGLPAFQAEQVTAMNLRKGGIDLDGLWEQKRKLIEQTPGLSVSRDGVTFDSLGGLRVVKDYLRNLCRGNDRPNAVVFVDEIEKMLAGATGGDLSGTSQDQLGTILSEMQDHRAIGVILVGHPGSGKSAIAKSAGNDAGIPTIQLDLGASKGGIVGQSEQQIRSALKTIRTVSNGRAMWIATCNSIGSLPPELRRRFKCGLFFFDLPTKEERDAIWTVHREKHGIDKQDPGVANDDGWTGAEIEQACELAWRLNKPLSYAANFVVPISVSAADRIESLRNQADGKWLSASDEGVYRRERAVVVGSSSRGRRVNVDE